MLSSRWVAILLVLSALVAVLAGAAQDSDERFQRLDRNGDGRLTPEELPEDWFARLDLNQDGVVTVDEAKRAVAGQRPSAVAAPPMAGHKDLVYAQVEGVDPNLLSLDLYVPDGATNAPIAVFVHGGSWQRGDKAQTEGTSLLASVISRGYVVAALNYRLAPAAQFPAYPEDVAAGVAWVREHAAEYGGDPKQLFLLGHSAGAHLVALVGTDQTYLKKHGVALTDLRAVVPLDTEAYDLPHLAERFGGRLLDTWSIPFGQDPEVWRRASPVTHVADARLTAWVGRLDPRTGLLQSENGCEHRIDTGISKWSRYSNGPEWGLDRNGPPCAM